MLNEQQIEAIKKKLQQMYNGAQAIITHNQGLLTSIKDHSQLNFASQYSEIDGQDTAAKNRCTEEIARQQQLQIRVEHSLSQLNSNPGIFDICAGCGQPIPFERLMAVPITPVCIRCKTGMKSLEAKTPYKKKPHYHFSEVPILSVR